MAAAILMAVDITEEEDMVVMVDEDMVEEDMVIINM